MKEELESDPSQGITLITKNILALSNSQQEQSDQLSTLLNNKYDLQATLRAKHQELSNLQAAYNQAQTQLRHLSNQFKVRHNKEQIFAQKSIQRLKEKKDQYSNQIELISQQLTSQQQINETQSKVIQKEIQENQAIEQQIELSHSHSHDLQSKIKEQEDQFDIVDQQIKQVSNDISNLKSEISIIQSEQVQLQTICDEMAQNNAELAVTAAEVMVSIQQRQENVELLGVLQNEQKDKSRQLDQIQDEVNETVTQKDYCEGQLKSEISNIESLMLTLNHTKQQAAKNRMQENTDFFTGSQQCQINQLQQEIQLFIRIAGFYKINVPKEISHIFTDLDLMSKQTIDSSSDGKIKIIQQSYLYVIHSIRNQVQLQISEQCQKAQLMNESLIDVIKNATKERIKIDRIVRAKNDELSQKDPLKSELQDLIKRLDAQNSQINQAKQELQQFEEDISKIQSSLSILSLSKVSSSLTDLVPSFELSQKIDPDSLLIKELGQLSSQIHGFHSQLRSLSMKFDDIEAVYQDKQMNLLTQRLQQVTKVANSSQQEFQKILDQVSEWMVNLETASFHSEMTSRNGNYVHEFAEKFKQEVWSFKHSVEKMLIESTNVRHLAEKAKQEFLKMNELQEFEIKIQQIEAKAKNIGVKLINQEFRKIKLQWIQEIEWALN